VDESSEIPLLPVSSTKFRVSGELSNWAWRITIPPVNWRNGTEVISFDKGSINSSWATAGEANRVSRVNQNRKYAGLMYS
jgi:secreted protein with Ig-like and vWFA domain